MRRTVLALALAVATAGAAQARAWSDAEAADLAAAAELAPAEGLAVPDEAAALEAARTLARFDPRFAPLRAQAADALLHRLAAEYAQGALRPSSVDPDWRIAPPAAPDMDALDRQIDAGAPVPSVLQALLPQSAEYAAVRLELARVAATEDADADQIARLRANLERLRWAPRALPTPRIEVRIAAYTLYFIGPDHQVAHDVIVGTRARPTPSLAAEVVSVTLNPYWTPPRSIATQELLPRFRRNPAAAAREGFEAVDSSGNVLDASAVNWSARPFPYQVRQRPGAANALGQIRLNMPNPDAVYLHDTPSRTLFDRANRALSHGCVRVRDPVALGADVLAQPEWDQTALESAIATGVNQDIDLATPLPVFFIYLTIAINADGSVQYLDDIYHRDAAIVRALDRPDQAPVRTAQALADSECAAP